MFGINGPPRPTPKTLKAFDAARQNAVIHVGVRKAASTYLQNHFNCDKATCFGGCARIAERVKAACESGSEGFLDGYGNDEIFDDLRFSGNFDLKLPMVLSSEHFVISPGVASGNLGRFLELGSRVLKRVAPEGRILIVTRNPEGWIRSAYHQRIREGAGNRFRIFLRREQAHIRACLDYRRIHDVYAAQFGESNVLMLPQELLLENATRFFCIFRDTFGIKTSGVADLEGKERMSANISPASEELEVIRRVNRFIKLVVDHAPANLIQEFQRETGHTPQNAFNLFFWKYLDAEKDIRGPRRILRLLVKNAGTGPLRYDGGGLLDDIVAESRRRNAFLTRFSHYGDYLSHYCET